MVHPEDVSQPPEGLSKEVQLKRMRRLLAMRVVNDECESLAD
jgi:hypothetical protein